MGPITYTEFKSASGISGIIGIRDPESFNNPPDLDAFREMIARRIPDPADPDRVTAYHLLKAYRRLSGQ